MDKFYKNNKLLFILFLVLLILLILGMEGVFSGTIFIVICLLYSIVVVGLIANLSIYFVRTRNKMNRLFDLYFGIYKLLYVTSEKYKKAGTANFSKMSEEINDKVELIKEEIKDYKIPDKLNKDNNKIFGLETFSISKENVEMLMSDDEAAINEFFLKMLRILRRLLVMLDEKKLVKREKELEGK